MCCLSPSYCAAVGAVLANQRGNDVRVLAITEVPHHGGRPVLRRRWPNGLSGRAACGYAANLASRDALARP